MTRLDSNPTSRFFSPAQADAIKTRYNSTCAACGSRDAAVLECDHWVAFNGSNTVVANGAALCGPCNRAKTNARIPGKPLAPRAALKAITVDEYFLQVQHNRAAFAAWVELYRGKGKCDKKATPFTAPY
jgi:hypothetical protein